jgi:hypothetical protein
MSAANAADAVSGTGRRGVGTVVGVGPRLAMSTFLVWKYKVVPLLRVAWPRNHTFLSIPIHKLPTRSSPFPLSPIHIMTTYIFSLCHPGRAFYTLYSGAGVV